MSRVLSLLCPTRGRPERMHQMAGSALATAADPDRVEILAYVDDVDDKLEAYKAVAGELVREHGAQGRIKLLIGPAIGVPRAMNILTQSARGEVICCATDDQQYVSNNWDTRLDEETLRYPDGIYCAWFNDGWESDRWCTVPMVGRQWIETVGYFLNPVFEHYYADTWVWMMAKKLDRAIYLPDVMCRHFHYKAGTREMDDTDRLRGADGGTARQKRDHETLNRYQRYLDLDAGLLRQAMGKAPAAAPAQTPGPSRQDTVSFT